MAVREAVREAGKDLAYGVPAFGVSFMSKIAGLTLQEWVYVVTILYTIILIGKQIPKMIGCAVCFLRERTCKRTCKD